jgi:predicted metalloendopeptidase
LFAIPVEKMRGLCDTLTWVLFFVVAGAFVAIVIALVALNTPSSPAKQALPPIAPQTAQDPLVFKRRSRAPAAGCVAGEHWDGFVCAPNCNTPLAFEGALMNASVPACDSFFHSMCGTWITMTMSGGTTRHRGFSYARERNRRLVREIIEESEPLSAFFRSCVHHNTSYAQDMEMRVELRHQLESVLGDFQNVRELPRVLGRLARRGYVGGGLAFSIERHPTQPLLIPALQWDGLRALRRPLVESLFQQTRTVTELGVRQMADRITRTLKVAALLEQRNEGHFLEDVHDYDQYVSVTFPNEHTFVYGDLAEPAWWWALFAQSLGAPRLSPRQPVWVSCMPYARWLSSSAASELDANDWRAYLEFVVIYNVHQFVPEGQQRRRRRSHDGRGPVGRPRAQRSLAGEDCLDVTRHALPGLVGTAFVAHSGFADRALVEDMVRNLLRVYRIRVANNTQWLSDEGRQRALAKLDAVQVHIATPEELPEPFAPTLAPDRYAHNMGVVRRYRVQRNLELWGTGDAAQLIRTHLPQTEANAYYSASSNSITVLAGLLMPPFYDSRFNEVSKYAILGTILGHELGHVLDHHGMRWDANGSYRVLWGDEDARAFEEHSQCVGRCAHRLGEDFADHVGLRLSYEALQSRATTLGERQYFFMSFAQAWCASTPLQEQCDPDTDVHSVPEFRVNNALRSMDAFRETFACHAGTSMCGQKCEVI